MIQAHPNQECLNVADKVYSSEHPSCCKIPEFNNHTVMDHCLMEMDPEKPFSACVIFLKKISISICNLNILDILRLYDERT